MYGNILRIQLGKYKNRIITYITKNKSALALGGRCETKRNIRSKNLTKLSILMPPLTLVPMYCVGMHRHAGSGKSLLKNRHYHAERGSEDENQCYLLKLRTNRIRESSSRILRKS